MKGKNRQCGLTLTEMTVVIVTIALLVGLGLPAVRALLNSFESGSGAKSMISATLASARAIAAREQRYAGVRFQKAYNPQGPLSASQYMVLIVQDPDILAYGFRAVEGLEPIKLPKSIGVMDLMTVARIYSGPINLQLTDTVINTDALISTERDLRDTTSFSIVFSPAGKMVLYKVWLRNRDGIPDSQGQVGSISADDVFNKLAAVNAGIGMFYQDDYFNAWWSFDPSLDLGLGPELSRNGFIIYERQKLRRAFERSTAWSQYLVKIAAEKVYINSYTGTIISAD